MVQSASRKLRAVTLVDSLAAPGGGERLALEVARRLDPDRFERTLCATRTVAPQHAEELTAAGVRILPLGRSSRADLRSWQPLLGLLRRERIDVLHSHKFGSNIWGAVIGSLARVPVIVAHEHTWSYEGQPLRRIADREVVARLSDAFVAVSQQDRRRMSEVEGIPPARTRFVPNGIPPLPALRGHDVRGEFGIPADAPLGVCVTIFRPQKALDVLVEAAALVAREHPSFRVLVVGAANAALAEPVLALARERGVAENVVVGGLRDDVADVLAAGDIALLSSDFEGSPLSVLEYMAAGKPVVATRVGGVPDLVRDGSEGLLVEPRDPAAFAAAVSRLVADAELRRRMGESARRRQREEFDIDVTVRRIEELYLELYARSRRGRRVRRSPTLPRVT
jgi:glycosyltransferase involved in cell wall biosynthesis